MMKPREILLYIILFSLLILIYFLTLNSLSELIKVPIVSLVSFSIPIITFLSIIVSASVAIFVMKKNHEENLWIRKKERMDQDTLTIMRSERILNDYIMISDGYSRGIKTTSDIQVVSIDKLLNEIERIISDCKKVREYDYYYIDNRQIEIFELTDSLIAISKNIENLLIRDGIKAQPKVISDKFNEIKSSLEEFFKDSKYITSKEMNRNIF
ncbi:hypothetical protein [Mammaliicoccus sciuri]|uniref:hypothetical protein n=2 Tax=Mammaliicoccus sciuri TaxID=1296 RepID=UPI00194E3998|nr:hypothetical protein [Mammaliicoccus sciuri]